MDKVSAKMYVDYDTHTPTWEGMNVKRNRSTQFRRSNHDAVPPVESPTIVQYQDVIVSVQGRL